MAHSEIVAGGILLLIVGLAASFYYESKTIWGIEYMRTYPYQNLGIALLLVGAILIGFGVWYSPQKMQQQSVPLNPVVPPTRSFCPFCGEKMVSGETRCRKCGRESSS